MYLEKTGLNSPDCSRLFVSDGGDIGEAVGNHRGDATKDSTEKTGEAEPGRIHALNTVQNINYGPFKK